MPYIATTPAKKSSGDVREMYFRQQRVWGFVPSYAKVFCHRPKVMSRWGRMLAEIKRPVGQRRLELVTLAAAHELRNSACSLAHGSELAKMIGDDAVIAMVKGESNEELSETDQAIVAFARGVVRDASKISSSEVSALKEKHGLSDAEIFDVAAIAASRSFFTKLLDALGAEPDNAFLKLNVGLRKALVVGRPISCRQPEVLSEEQEA